jgi:hypothetical protein
MLPAAADLIMRAERTSDTAPWDLSIRCRLRTAPADIAQNTQTVFSSLYSDKIFELNPAGFYAALRELAALNACLRIRTYSIVIPLNVLSPSSPVLLSWHTRPHSIQ